MRSTPTARHDVPPRWHEGGSDPARWSRRRTAPPTERAAGWSARRFARRDSSQGNGPVEGDMESSKLTRRSFIGRSAVVVGGVIAAPAVLEACAPAAASTAPSVAAPSAAASVAAPSAAASAAAPSAAASASAQWPEERVRRPVAGRRRTEGAAVHARDDQLRGAGLAGDGRPREHLRERAGATTASTSRSSGWTRTGRSSRARPRSGRSPPTA